ncbi:hypothetical protein C1646_767672 [Rhizophagus diaphanus]|nr:hypothetical protein C1646_767672 [Rhizophagus diaphanus] [Rhizophagus sp. MUCL 43196]
MLKEMKDMVVESREKNMKIMKRVCTVLTQQESEACTWPWELRRISAFGSTVGTKFGSCRFVYPHFHVRKGGSLEPMHKMPEGGGLDESCRSCNSSPIVIEVIANEYERNLFASYINHGNYCEISNLNCIKPGSNLEDYVDEVQEYGFNHIILIGEREHGIIFLDCYGRLFILDTMTGVLWHLRDTLDEAVTKPWTGELAWSVDEGGTIFEMVEEQINDIDFEEEVEDSPLKELYSGQTFTSFEVLTGKYETKKRLDPTENWEQELACMECGFLSNASYENTQI